MSNYKADKKTTAGKIIDKLIENIENRIRNNDNNSQIFNHLYSSVAKFLVTRLYALNVDGAQKTEDFDKITIIAGINGIIAQTMSYIDNVFTNNDINKLDPSNEKDTNLQSVFTGELEGCLKLMILNTLVFKI